MNFDLADKAIKNMNRRNLRAFDGLKTLKFDELNVLKSVAKVYDNSVSIAKRRYRQIAEDAYLEALILAGMERKKAEKLAEESITDDWVLTRLRCTASSTRWSERNSERQKRFWQRRTMSPRWIRR